MSMDLIRIRFCWYRPINESEVISNQERKTWMSFKWQCLWNILQGWCANRSSLDGCQWEHLFSQSRSHHATLIKTRKAHKKFGLAPTKRKRKKETPTKKNSAENMPSTSTIIIATLVKMAIAGTVNAQQISAGGVFRTDYLPVGSVRTDASSLCFCPAVLFDEWPHRSCSHCCTIRAFTVPYAPCFMFPSLYEHTILS